MLQSKRGWMQRARVPEAHGSDHNRPLAAQLLRELGPDVQHEDGRNEHQAHDKNRNGTTAQR
jgi:hypothetical protein